MDSTHYISPVRLGRYRRDDVTPGVPPEDQALVQGLIQHVRNGECAYLASGGYVVVGVYGDDQVIDAVMVCRMLSEIEVA